MTCIGLINPGAMGASVGAAAAGNGYQVLWASEGRSDASCERAQRAGLVERSKLSELIAESDVILSICPPEVALVVADRVASSDYQGIYVDANAISPVNARAIDKMFSASSVVDGGIIGGPAWQASSGTCLYLSGSKAEAIADLFTAGPLKAKVVSSAIGAASALKMCFAAYSKGTSALLGGILALAEHEGVREALEAQWGDEFTAQAEARVRASSAKAWRFTGEMLEIAATFEAAGLPGEFHRAAAAVYDRQAQFKDAKPFPELTAIIAALLASTD